MLKVAEVISEVPAPAPVTQEPESAEVGAIHAGGVGRAAAAVEAAGPPARVAAGLAAAVAVAGAAEVAVAVGGAIEAAREAVSPTRSIALMAVHMENANGAGDGGIEAGIGGGGTEAGTSCGGNEAAAGGGGTEARSNEGGTGGETNAC